MFIVSRVGSSSDAEKFLGELDNDKELEQMVFCSTEKLDDQLAVFQRCENNEGYNAYVSMPATTTLLV